MDVDTSSYPKPQQTNFLDTASKLQGLEQQKVGIDQAKLNLMNERYGILNKELSSLISDPSVTPDKIIQSSQNLVKLGIIPPDMHATFISQIPTQTQVQQNPSAIRNFLERTLTRTMSTQEAVNFHYGAPGTFNNGQQTTPVVTSPKFGMRATGLPIQIQLPPATEVATPGGSQLLGPQAPVSPGPGISSNVGNSAPTRTNPLPVGPVNDPRILGPSSNLGGTVIGAEVGPNTVGGAYKQPTGPMTSQPPLFEEGKKALAEDQALATSKLTAIKPALQALPLLNGLRSGPTTAKFNEVVAALKANNIIPTDTKNDPTAIYQEVNKKLAQYVSSNPVGQRSDAAQTLAEAASPSPKTQINPALVKLTKDAIILDRVQAARAGAFTDNKGNQRTDLQNYGQHRSSFPASVDERAFGIDLMEPKDRVALLNDMKKKANTFEGKKFWRSLAIVDRQGLIDTGGGQ